MNPARPSLALLAVVALAGCRRGPEPIRYGKDECAECKMTLVDQHYGAEHVTGRGKVYRFDDVTCLGAYRRRTGAADAEGRSYVVDFRQPNHFLPVEAALLLRHDALRTPMGGQTAAFATEPELEAARRELGGGGQMLRWAEAEKLLQ